MRAVIVDDEPIARRGLSQLVAAHADVVVVGEARNGPEAVRMLNAVVPDLVFLDVQMPEFDGFEVLRRLTGELPAVIFVTAYDSYAVRAFETHALDYLMKPVTEARLADALAWVRSRMQTLAALEKSRRVAELVQSGEIRLDDPAKEPSRKIILQDGPAALILDTAEIEWIEADDYYAAVHARGERRLIRESLDSLERRLDAIRFVRVHRRAIVNLAFVKEVRADAGGAFLLLADGTRAPLSRRRREGVAAALRRFAG